MGLILKICLIGGQTILNTESLKDNGFLMLQVLRSSLFCSHSKKEYTVLCKEPLSNVTEP